MSQKLTKKRRKKKRSMQIVMLKNPMRERKKTNGKTKRVAAVEASTKT
jgi:hypothetical protein